MPRRVVLTMSTAVVLVAFAAWLPSLRPYLAAAEDFGRAHVTHPSLAAYGQWMLAHSEVEGLWRVMGLPFTDIARNFHPLGFPTLTLLCHAFNGVLVALLLLRLGTSRMLALAAAIFFVVLPSAIEANMYAVSSQSIQATTMFLLVAHYLVFSLRAPPRALGLAGCFLAALVGNATQENLMFAYVAMAAAIAHVQRPVPTWTAATVRCVLAYSLCTLLAIATYAGVTLGLQTDPTKSPSINFGTLAAFPIYQYTNFFPYEIWLQGGLVALVIEHETVVVAGLSAALLLAGLVLARRAMDGDAPVVDALTRARDRRVLESMLVLWYAAGLVYVLGGGYSFESRKKYVTLLFLAVTLAFAITRLFQAMHTPAGRRRVATAAAGVAVVTAMTTWFVASLWILETRRGAALVRAIAAHPEIETLHVRFIPDLPTQWPNWRAVASSQHSSSWVTELEVARRLARTIKVVPAGDSVAVIECRYVRAAEAACEVKDVADQILK